MKTGSYKTNFCNDAKSFSVQSPRLNSCQIVTSYEPFQTLTKDFSKNSISISKIINGKRGGTVSIKSIRLDKYNNPVSIIAKLFIPRASFSGETEITLKPSIKSAAIDLFPAMKFDKNLTLDYSIYGLNLSEFGFNENESIEFVFIDNEGNTERVINDGVIVNQNKNKLSVKNARINHFSRYCWKK